MRRWRDSKPTTALDHLRQADRHIKRAQIALVIAGVGIALPVVATIVTFAADRCG